MREESLSFLSFLMSLLMFLFISEIRARKLQQCSSSCGEINNINYPFRLRGDPANCGDSDFELSCESNKTILEFNSEKYYVKEIFHRERIINVVNVNLANGSCSLPYKSPVTEDNLPQFYYPIVTHASVDFLKCYRNISDRDYSRVPCLSGNNSFVYITYLTYSVSDIPVSCSVISVVSSQFHLMSTFNETPPYETFREILQMGHNLTWSVECRDCAKDSGHCGIIPTLSSPPTFPFICHYDEGFIETQILSRLEEIKQALLALFHSDSFSEYLDYFLNATSQTIFLFLCFVPLFSRFILAPIILLLYILHKYRRKYNRTDNVEKFLHNQQSWMPKRYSYAEIMAMTNHFEVHLGKGGFGSVYKGQLRRGCLIAVKVLENSKFCAEEFINEVSTIGRIHHVNVVQLVGFCAEGSKRALVYEYMPNGSLDRHIFSKVDGGTTPFSWEKLHEIALATARGIEYLHVGCDVCILHFDIKPHNILLDHNFHPKVSDFGLAKFYPKENDFVSVSATRGTIGYIAPELVSRNFGTISCKSDVYSFGMLLLEMVGGRRNSDMREARSSRAYFPSWVYDKINLGEDLELPNVSEIEVAIAKKLCIIGLWCIQVKPVDRPSMTKVMEMLEGSIDELQMPPKPFFSSTQHISIGEIESDSSNQWLLSESIEESMIVE